MCYTNAQCISKRAESSLWIGYFIHIVQLTFIKVSEYVFTHVFVQQILEHIIYTKQHIQPSTYEDG